ncbi:MAG: hypothetical protein AAFN50_11665 [Pseudomonadota bacterium]
MVNVVGETLEEAERKLLKLTWALDRTEYDGDEEFEERTKGIFPDQITAQAEHAASLGSIPGLHALARIQARQALERQKKGQPYEDLQAKARDLAIQAARGGCWGAMSDLGRMMPDEFGVEVVEMLAFMELDGGDMMDYVKTCNSASVDTYSENDINAAIELAKKISQEMESAGIEKKQCDCFDPFEL